MPKKTTQKPTVEEFDLAVEIRVTGHLVIKAASYEDARREADGMAVVDIIDQCDPSVDIRIDDAGSM